MSDRPTFPGFQQLLFDTPLYEEVALPISDEEKAAVGNDPLDGYCPSCERTSLFRRQSFDFQKSVSTRGGAEVILRCARADSHVLRFNLLFSKAGVQKIGQFPSFATITQSTMKEYRNFLSKDDASELYKATGLIAHGVGIGAFVYIRRVFERIIRTRFDEHKSELVYTEEQFNRLRMGEKIEALAAHLPDFLAKNRRLYSILSLGIHELSERDCIEFFPVAHSSIVFMLADDKRKRDEAEQRSQVERAISAHRSG